MTTVGGSQQKEGTGSASLTLVLPASYPAPDYAKDRITTLTINGKSHPIKADSEAKEMTVKIDRPARLSLSRS